MTVAITTFSTTTLGDGVNTSFSFAWPYVAPRFVEFILTHADGTQTTINPSLYSLAVNPPVAGQLWGIGGTLTYPLLGSPLPAGSTGTVQRVLPFTQGRVISNQGSFYPNTVEGMSDYLTFLAQQVNGAVEALAAEIDPTPPAPPADLTHLPFDIQFAASDETTPLVIGTDVITFRAPRAFILQDVRASLSSAGLTQTIVDIKLNGVTVLATLIRIDGGTTTSLAAAIQPVVSTQTVPDDGAFTVDITAAGTSAAGLKITLLGILDIAPIPATTLLPIDLDVAASDETTQLTTGTAVITFRAPRAFTLTAVKASLSIAGLTETIVDIQLSGVTVLSTLITIDGGTSTSLDAATQPVIGTAAIPDDGELTVDITAAGTSAAGLKVTLLGVLS